MERIIRFRNGQVKSIDVLRESVKLLSGDIARAITGEPATGLRKYLLDTAARQPPWNHFDTRRLDAVADELFELYWECRFLLSTWRPQRPTSHQGKLEERASRLMQLLAEVFELDPAALDQELGSGPPETVNGLPGGPVDEQSIREHTAGLLRALETFAATKAERKTQLRLRISLAGSEQIEVTRADRGRASAVPSVAPMPYSTGELEVILKVIGASEASGEKLEEDEIALLLRNGLVQGHRKRRVLRRLLRMRSRVKLSSEYHCKIGERLFSVLFIGEAAELYRRRNKPSKPLALRLFIDPSYPALSRLPWELVYDKSSAISVARNGMEVSRCLETDTGLKQRLEIAFPLSVLYIDTHPQGALSEQALQDALKPLDEAGLLELQTLKAPTWPEIVNELDSRPYDIVHYDGRGVFGYQCASCGFVAQSADSRCRNCRSRLAATEPKGYILPGEGEVVKPVSADEFSLHLDGSGTELVVLNANSSATVGGDSVYRGVAPSLVRAGVPAVVALQGEMQCAARQAFVRSFYQGIVSEEAVPEAVNRGRRKVFSEWSTDWYKPVVYLHTESRYGDLHYVPGLRTGYSARPVSELLPEHSGITIQPVSPKYGHLAGFGDSSDPQHKLAVGLRQILEEKYSLEELRTLCHDLGVDYDDLPARGRAANARELVTLLHKRGRLAELIRIGRERRPDIDWPEPT